MGKNILVIFFLATVVAAVYLFVGRDAPRTPLHDLDPGQKRLPRIQFEEFTIYKYEGHTALSTASGNLASFVDPNMLELMGDIQGQSLDSPHKEFFSSESAHVTFSSRGLGELMKSGRMQRAEIENQVRFGYDDTVLFTNYAKYTSDDRRLSTDLPVHIKGPRIEMDAAKGFIYQTETRDLKVFGPMEGTLLGIDKAN